MQTPPPPRQVNLLCIDPLLLYPRVTALQSPAFSATEFSGLVILVFDTLGSAQHCRSPLSDMYPYLVIFSRFLVAFIDSD